MNYLILIYLNSKEEGELLKNVILRLNSNFRIVAVADIQEFQKVIKTFKVDILIVEYELKNQDCFELILSLRKDKKFENTLIGFYADRMSGIIKEQFSALNINFILDIAKDPAQIKEELVNASEEIKRQRIPDDFKILVLDDSEEILELISSYLLDMGHDKFVIGRSVQDGIKLLNKYEFDLMILDWNLKDGTCIDFIEKISSLNVSERTKNSIKVIETGRSGIEDMMTLLKYNITNIIIKPYDYSEFKEKITYAIEKK